MAKPGNKKAYTLQERYADFHSTFGTPSGRRVLQYLYDTFMRPSAVRMSPGGVDPNMTLVMLGKQEVYRHIMAVLSFDNFEKFEEAVYARSIAEPTEN